MKCILLFIALIGFAINLQAQVITKTDMTKPLIVGQATNTIRTLTGLEADTAIYTQVEVFPSQPSYLVQYFSNFQHQIDTTQKISGLLVVRFIVEKDGSTSSIHITKKLSPYLDQEAVKMFKNSPKWEPGMINKKIVRCWVDYPVRFIK